MRAVTIRSSGGPISLTEREARPPGTGEVRLNVRAATVNPVDTLMWRTFTPSEPQTSLTPGMDAAGTVESVGPDVSGLNVGDAFMAAINARTSDGGAQAELVVVPAASVAPIPDGLDLLAASTLPMNALTAMEALNLLRLEPGATLAVTGGAGLLASYAIALAKEQGLTVIADAKPEDAELVSSFGADHVVGRGEDFTAEVRKLVPAGVDAVLDTAVIGRAAVPAIRDRGAIAVVRGWDNDGEPERGIRAVVVSVAKEALLTFPWVQ